MGFSGQEYWRRVSYSFLQRIFPTQGSNLGLLYYRQILYHPESPGMPKYNPREGIMTVDFLLEDLVFRKIKQIKGISVIEKRKDHN